MLIFLIHKLKSVELFWVRVNGMSPISRALRHGDGSSPRNASAIREHEIVSKFSMNGSWKEL